MPATNLAALTGALLILLLSLSYGHATLSAYRVGRADFASLYRAQLQLLDFQRTILTSRTESVRAAARIATITGGSTSFFESNP